MSTNAVVEVSTEKTYEYHGGAAPPTPTERVVLPDLEEDVLKEAVVQEHVRDVEVEEIQPVVERERIVTEVQQVVQPVLDVVNEAPIVEQTVLEEEEHKFKEKTSTESIERYEAQASAFKDEHSHVVVHETIYKEPIIHETVKHKIIKEVQPVIERVVTKTHVIQETQPIKEVFVKAPIVHEQEVNAPVSMADFEAASKTKRVSPSKTPLKDVIGSHPISSTSPSKTPKSILKSTSTKSTSTKSTATKSTPSKSPKQSTSPTTSTSTRSTSPGPLTRLKRKRLAEAAEETDVLADEPSSTIILDDAETMDVDDDGDVEVDTPIEPSLLHGRFEKVLGTVEAGIGELVGSEKLVQEGERKISEGEREIEAAREGKRRRVEV